MVGKNVMGLSREQFVGTGLIPIKIKEEMTVDVNG